MKLMNDEEIPPKWSCKLPFCIPFLLFIKSQIRKKGFMLNLSDK